MQAMQSFAALLERLVLTPSRNAKLQLICDYLCHTGDPSRGWAIAAITGDLNIPSVKPAAIRALVADRIDPVLFNLSYDYVGDLAETISLIWPQRPGANRSPDLNEVVETLMACTKAQGLLLVEGWLDTLDPTGRWALLKLVTGGLRIGVSARLARQALADYGTKAGGKVDVSEIEELWHGMVPPYLDLLAWLDQRGLKPVSGALSPFRPPMLAHPLLSKAERFDAADLDPSLISPNAFAAEWKWDGVRVQLTADKGVRRLYTRNGDDISKTFPDLLEAANFSAAIDGELLIRSPQGGVASFNELQQRLNRRLVSQKQMAERPAMLRAYDLLQHGDHDLRPLPFSERRKRLERCIVTLDDPRIDLSPLVPFTDAAALDDLRRNPPTNEIEGLMLKRWDAPYVAGRPAGQWYKWKRDPYLVDAVLMYAQRGPGKRSGLYSDFTFGVWRTTGEGEELTPVGKAYSGFTDAELRTLDKYVRDNTIDRYGPVRSVTASRNTGLVLEIAFEGLQRSPRHRSGLAMRFPRVHRIRWDKPSREADRIETLEAMLQD